MNKSKMNLNKIETDQPGFILQISWNSKAEGDKATNKPKEKNKNHLNAFNSNEFQFCFKMFKI